MVLASALVLGWLRVLRTPARRKALILNLQEAGSRPMVWVLGSSSDGAALRLENLALRYPLAVLSRTVCRPRIRGWVWFDNIPSAVEAGVRAAEVSLAIDRTGTGQRVLAKGHVVA